MNANQIILVLFLLFLTPLINAQDYIISGQINDSTTDEPLLAANIAVNDAVYFSDFNGLFEFSLPSGEYQMVVSYIGFDDQITTLSINDNISELSILLNPTNTLLETATITGSKYERRLADVPVSINVITPEIISNVNTIEINTLLDKVPGVQIIDGQANIRGGSGYSFGAGSRVMLLIDDIPSMQPDAGRPNWDDIPVENVSQIEVLKGASSVLYGSAALNGIINIRTGYALAKPVTKLNFSYGHFMAAKDPRKQWWEGGLSDSPNQMNFGFLHKRKFGNLDVVLNGFYNKFDHFYQESFKNKGRGSVNLRYRVNDLVTVGVNTVFNKSHNAIPFLRANDLFGAYKPLAGTISDTKATRFYIDPFLTIYDKKGNKHKFLTRYYYINNDNNNNQGNSSKNFYGDYNYTKHIKSIGTHITAGLTGSYLISDAELFANGDFSASNFGLYLQGEKKIDDRLNISAGARFENNQHNSPEIFLGDTIPNGVTKESKIIKRASLSYELTPYTFLRASYGEGYRYPTITERFISTTFSTFAISPNTKVRSETGYTTELGIKQGFKVSQWKGYADFAAFYSSYDDMLEFSFCDNCGEAGFQSQNIGNVEIKGFEFNLVGQFSIFGTPINILSGYTYIDPTYRDFDTNSKIMDSLTPSGVNVLKYRTKHNFKVDVETTIKGAGIGLSFNRTSHMETIDAPFGLISGINLYREFDSNGYYRFDGRISYQFEFAKLTFLANNMLNEEYTQRPGFFEAPRNIALRMDFNF